MPTRNGLPARCWRKVTGWTTSIKLKNPTWSNQHENSASREGNVTRPTRTLTRQPGQCILGWSKHLKGHFRRIPHNGVLLTKHSSQPTTSSSKCSEFREPVQHSGIVREDWSLHSELSRHPPQAG